MVDKLRLEVMLAAVDKVSGPLKKIATGSKATADAIGEAELALKKLEAQQRKLQRLQDAKSGMGKERNALRVEQTNLAGLKASGTATAKQIAAQERAVEKQTAAYERQRNVVLRLRSEVSAMGLGSVSQSQQHLSEQIDKTTEAMKRQKAAFEQQRQVEARLANLRERHGKTMMRLGMAGATAAVGMQAGRRIVQTGLAPVDSFMQHEDAMMGVIRQVNGARDSKGNLTGVYRKAEAEIRALSERIPQTTVQIAEMYTAAARMEVPTDKLADFVQLSSDMATAFDAVPDVIAESMGKIANNLKIPVTEMRGMADAINYLDDNAISKGADIVGFLNRVGGVAGTVGITGKDMAALGSTLLTSGETEETAGTGVKAIFTNFAAATKGSKRFKRGVDDIGMTPQELQTGMAKDAVGTLERVAEAIKKLPKKEQMGVMADLAGKEHIGQLAKLVTNTEELRRQIDLANGAQAKGSMAREAAARNSALSAQLQMEKNRLFNAGAIAGETLKVAILDLLQVVNPWLAKLSEWMKKNPALVGNILKMVVVLGALLTGISALGLGIITLLGPMVLARFVLSSWLLGMVQARVAAMGIEGAVRLLSGAMSGGLVTALRAAGSAMWALVANPVGLVIASLALGALLIYKYWQPLKAFFTGLWAGFSEALGPAFTELTNAFAPLRPVLDWFVGALGDTWNWLAKLIEPMQGTQQQIDGWTASGKAFGLVLGGIVGHLTSILKLVPVIGPALQMAGWVGAKMGGGTAESHQGVAQPANGAVKLGASTAPLLSGGVLSAIQPTAMGAMGRGTYNITVNAAPGMDEKALARAVTFEMDRRERSNASRRFSRLSDID